MSEIMVVDDSAVDRRLVGGLLQQRDDWRITFARNGAEAIEKMQQLLPDVVIADVVMPEMDGLELVNVIRDRFPLVPIVLMTSQGNEKLALRALRQGASSYVPKRLLADELVDTVQHVLGAASGRISHSRVMRCLSHGMLEFELENDCLLVGPLVSYLQETAGYLGLCLGADRTRVGIALEEALVNAMHHGNLEVSSSLRDEDDEAYGKLISQRRQLTPYADRRVHVRAMLNPDRALFVIRDSGPGFDHRSLPDPTDPANLDKLSGRGVLLMRTFMDEVVYNDVGNEVTMIKHRHRAEMPAEGKC